LFKRGSATTTVVIGIRTGQTLRRRWLAAYYADPARANARRVEYERRHPATSRRLRKLRASICDLTFEQWQGILGRYSDRCAYCGRGNVKLTKDQVIPLSGGGAHTASNIVPACRPCNTAKGTKLWVPRLSAEVLRAIDD
jgi:5-methylcytosine-specific restriction endonuclease McrA